MVVLMSMVLQSSAGLPSSDDDAFFDFCLGFLAADRLPPAAFDLSEVFGRSHFLDAACSSPPYWEEGKKKRGGKKDEKEKKGKNKKDRSL